MRGIAGASYASLFGLLICVVPLVAGAWFAIRPNERLLSLMRPLTLAAIFSALCSFVLAVTNGFLMIGDASSLDPGRIRLAAVVVTEGMAPVIASFACMTAAWACVAIGMRRG
jgi:hypothetical protein